jgi:hypothetical protein
VHDGFDTVDGGVDRAWIADVADDVGDVKVVRLDHVEHPYVVTSLDQCRDDVPADEPAPAGEQDPHYVSLWWRAARRRLAA